MSKNREVTKIDEVELYLEATKNDAPELIEGKTYKQISDSLNKKFGINSTEEDVFLLHEPTIEDMEEDLKVYFDAIGLVY